MAYFHQFGTKITLFLCRFPYFRPLSSITMVYGAPLVYCCNCVCNFVNLELIWAIKYCSSCNFVNFVNSDEI